MNHYDSLQTYQAVRKKERETKVSRETSKRQTKYYHKLLHYISFLFDARGSAGLEVQTNAHTPTTRGASAPILQRSNCRAGITRHTSTTPTQHTDSFINPIRERMTHSLLYSSRQLVQGSGGRGTSRGEEAQGPLPPTTGLSITSDDDQHDII